MPPDGTMSTHKKKSQNFFSFFFIFSTKRFSEGGFDWGNDSHMLMDDHGLVLIRNTDMGCYRDRGLSVCQRVSVCAAIWKEKQHSQKKDLQNVRGIQKRRKDGGDQRLPCIAAHPPTHPSIFINISTL